MFMFVSAVATTITPYCKLSSYQPVIIWVQMNF